MLVTRNTGSPAVTPDPLQNTQNIQVPTGQIAIPNSVITQATAAAQHALGNQTATTTGTPNALTERAVTTASVTDAEGDDSEYEREAVEILHSLQQRILPQQPAMPLSALVQPLSLGLPRPATVSAAEYPAILQEFNILVHNLIHKIQRTNFSVAYQVSSYSSRNGMQRIVEALDLVGKLYMQRTLPDQIRRLFHQTMKPVLDELAEKVCLAREQALKDADPGLWATTYETYKAAKDAEQPTDAERQKVVGMYEMRRLLCEENWHNLWLPYFKGALNIAKIPGASSVEQNISAQELENVERELAELTFAADTTLSPESPEDEERESALSRLPKPDFSNPLPPDANPDLKPQRKPTKQDIAVCKFLEVLNRNVNAAFRR